MIKHFLFVFILFTLSGITIAQDITGNIEGMVTDSLSNPLPGVNISVQSENLQGLKGTATNERGYFSIFYLLALRIVQSEVDDLFFHVCSDLSLTLFAEEG